MGKVEQNKQEKFENLLNSAQQLFMTKGIPQTSISDITKQAGVAKGTFYLYFKDKYSIRDYLVVRASRRLFASADQALRRRNDIKTFEDRLVFFIDYMILELEKNKSLLHFISKNLSWGMFKHLMQEDISQDKLSGIELFECLAKDCGVALRDADVMGFMLVELTNSTCYSAIMEPDTIALDELMPYLNDSIRAIIRNHIVETKAEDLPADTVTDTPLSDAEPRTDRPASASEPRTDRPASAASESRTDNPVYAIE